MRQQPASRRFLVAPALGLACAAAVAACGSGGSSGSGSSPAASAPAASAPAASAKAPGSAPPSSPATSPEAQIKANWKAFFSAKTPTSKRVTLLQNGQKFASTLREQASSPLASSASAAVSSVKVESATQAKVTYSVLVGGTPELKNQPGVAVKQGGRWKVGEQSFCALLTLENNGKAPAVCAGSPG